MLDCVTFFSLDWLNLRLGLISLISCARLPKYKGHDNHIVEHWPNKIIKNIGNRHSFHHNPSNTDQVTIFCFYNCIMNMQEPNMQIWDIKAETRVICFHVQCPCFHLPIYFKDNWDFSFWETLQYCIILKYWFTNQGEKWWIIITDGYRIYNKDTTAWNMET